MSPRANVTDILCIGCQKGSTSWLHSVLNCHPHTWSFVDSEPVTSTDKEAHYWDWNHHRGADWYRALMTPPDPSLRSMDFTPEYACLPAPAIAECKALNPEAKVIYILRDPLARAVSAIRMYVLWHHGKDHRAPMRLGEELYFMMREAKLPLHSDYLKNLRAWRKEYPDLLVINYEDFHRDRPGSVRRILQQLNLDPEALDGRRKRRLAEVMDTRIWASEPYPFDRGALMMLHGLTWRYRQEIGAELGMRFAEGDAMLSG